MHKKARVQAPPLTLDVVERYGIPKRAKDAEIIVVMISSPGVTAETQHTRTQNVCVDEDV